MSCRRCASSPARIRFSSAKRCSPRTIRARITTARCSGVWASNLSNRHCRDRSGLAFYQAALERLAESSRLRSLVPRQGSTSPRTITWGSRPRSVSARAVAAAIARGTPVGAGGSRLLRGNAPEHEELEAPPRRSFTPNARCSSAAAIWRTLRLLSTLPQNGRFPGPRRAGARERARGRPRGPRASAGAAQRRGRLRTRDRKMADGGRPRADLDCGRESLQHGRGLRAARGAHRGGRAVRCDAADR